MTANSRSRGILLRLAAGVVLAGIGTLAGQRWLAHQRTEALATPSPAPRAPYPAELDAIAKALAGAPAVHIAGSFPGGRKTRWESWRQGESYRLEDDAWAAFSDGTRSGFFDKDKKRAWLATNPNNPALPESKMLEKPSRPLLIQQIEDGFDTAQDWKVEPGSITVRMDVGGFLNEHKLTFDPATKLPKEETIDGPVGAAPPKVVKLDFATPSPVPTPVMTPPPKESLARFTFDYAPAPPATFLPTPPPELRLYDLDIIRATWKPRFEKEKARIELGGKTLLLRDIRINRQGDIYVFYTGKVPEQHVTIKGEDGKSVPMFGVLEVVDSLGNRTAPLPTAAQAFGREPRPTPPPTTVYEVFGKRDTILLMQKDFPESKPNAGDGMSYLAVRAIKPIAAATPRRITLRFVLLARDPSVKTQVKEFTTEPLAPEGEGTPDIVVPYTTTSVDGAPAAPRRGRPMPPPP